jgi:uncharacterized membrane protein YedE/YeeE
VTLFCGVLFGLGLAISGMTDTQKVLGFLNIFGEWDISLMFVMAAGLAITIPSFYFIHKRIRPIFEDKFYLPTSKALDKKLIVGSALFGIGWGLYGYCPGPAIAALAYLNQDAFIFVGSMLLGMFLTHRLTNLNSA